MAQLQILKKNTGTKTNRQYGGRMRKEALGRRKIEERRLIHYFPFILASTKLKGIKSFTVSTI